MNQYRVAGLLLSFSLVSLGACVSRSAYDKEREEREVAVQKWQELSRYQSELESERRALKHEVDQLRLLVDEKTKSAADANADRSRYREKLEELERKLGAFGANSGGDVDVYQTAEGTVVEIKEGVLFDSGKKAIKSKGQEILNRLAAELASSGYDIRVDGHTDTDPVVKHAKEYPYGNLQLSVERALEVAHFLSKTASSPIPEGRLHVSGFGPNKPRVEGSGADAKQKNRRVDLVILKGALSTEKAAAVEAAGSNNSK